MLIFSIGLVFSADAPLIVPWGLLYFACKHQVDKYNIMYVRPHEYANSNSFTKTVRADQWALSCCSILHASAYDAPCRRPALWVGGRG
jgi:hypothetical protein